MIRKSVIDKLWQWRDPFIGGTLIGLGAWAGLGSFGTLRWLGWIALGFGALMLWTGWQRLRFATQRDGPGVVQVTEGQVTYFGPLTGGGIARSNLTSVEHDASGKPAHWVLDQTEGSELHIPVTASGAEELFDFFSSLPGIRTETLLRAANKPGQGRTLIWRRDDDAPNHRLSSS